MKRNFMLVVILLAALFALISGCGPKQAEGTDFSLPVAAYQSAKSEVQVLLANPNTAVFPMISENTVAIEELANNIILVASSVTYHDPDANELISQNFTVILKHLGEGIFETDSIDFD